MLFNGEEVTFGRGAKWKYGGEGAYQGDFSGLRGMKKSLASGGGGTLPSR